MRWSIIRLIWVRELRDQLRDRRTLLMIAGLPLVLYPVLGFAVLQFARGFAERPSVIGVVTGDARAEAFPTRPTPQAGRSPVPAVAALAATPLPGPAGTQAVAAAALTHAGRLNLDYPSLIEGGEIVAAPGQGAAPSRLHLVFLPSADRAPLDERKVDLILSAPADFFAQVQQAEDPRARLRPTVEIAGREGDDHSRLALRRLAPLLESWKKDLKRVRLARLGFHEQFDDPFAVQEPEPDRSLGAEQIVDLMTRMFPFMLVMWSLAGALYPAVDLCAGEKERGTMETLLITPAGREEIVLGKFLTIWVFSAGTALLNLLSMGITSWQLAGQLPQGGNLSPAALFWCVFLLLPQAAFFSAISLAIGAYARSSKEGQYYLMPLFVLTMPLIFLTLAPGVELNPVYSLVPVTGVALLMQKLMTAPSLAQVPWLYFLPVLLPVALYSWLALRWAIEQFQHEEVLFREAERLDLGLWVQRLLREKEPLPTTGQAFFAFGLILLLRWLSLGLGAHLPLEVHAGTALLAFVAAPPLFMVTLLTTRPLAGLALRWPTPRQLGLAALLAVLLLPPMAGLTEAVAAWFPSLLEDRHPLVVILRAVNEGAALPADRVLPYLFSYALLPAVCEELAFRGFILAGLHSRFRPRNAVLLSSFLFALYHMNVFLFLPTFLLGVALGLLTVRSKSLLPAVCFHFLHNAVLIGSIFVGRGTQESGLADGWPWLVGGSLLITAAVLWWLYRKPYADLARAERAEAEREQAARSAD